MNPENEAKNLLETIGLNKLPVIAKDIVDDLGIVNREHTFNSIEGFSIFDSSGQKTFIGINSNLIESRKNFTYAHELGHLCLDSFKGNYYCCQAKDINGFSKGLDQVEINANVFASCLLLPEFLIKNKIKNIDPDWNEISELAKLTKTSLTTMVIRFVELTDHICSLVVINKNKLIKYFRKSSNWSLRLNMDGRIVASPSFAYRACNQENISNTFESVPANIWISDKRISKDTEILEWSLPINIYGDVMTLLWDDEGILEKDESETNIYSIHNKLGGVWDPPTFHKSKRKP